MQPGVGIRLVTVLAPVLGALGTYTIVGTALFPLVGTIVGLLLWTLFALPALGLGLGVMVWARKHPSFRRREPKRWLLGLVWILSGGTAFAISWVWAGGASVFALVLVPLATAVAVVMTVVNAIKAALPENHDAHGLDTARGFRTHQPAGIDDAEQLRPERLQRDPSE